MSYLSIMNWNWRKDDWPNFSFSADAFGPFEDAFLYQAGVFNGSLQAVSKDNQETLTVDLMSNEAYKTSEIEGDLLNRDSLRSSIKKHFGLKTDDRRRVTPSEYGVSELMVDLYQHFQVPLTHDQLFAWHSMLMNGRRDLTKIGAYRTHKDPMQIVSGRMDLPKVHFEAPPSHRVPKEMEGFVRWFNESTGLRPLVRAGIAHLYFESIHPFEDGNGRIGRALSEKALSQSIGRPSLISISQEIEANKKAYYEALHRHSFGLEITPWLAYFCEMVLNAQKRSQRAVEFLIEKGRFYERYAQAMNDRQEKVVQRMFREGVDGFEGGLSASNYQRIAKTPSATATRDLQKMVELGAFTKTGQKKGTRYHLAMAPLAKGMFA